MNGLRAPLLAAGVGAVVLLLFFRMGDPTGRYPVKLDRAHAVQRAAHLSESYGVSVAGWRIDVTTITNENLRSYRDVYYGDPAARLFTPLDWGVRFHANDGRTVRVRLTGDGRPVEWQFRGSPLPSPPQETVLADFLGDNRTDFHPVDAAPQAGVRRQFWEWSAGENFPLVAEFEISRAENRFEVKLDQRYEHGYKMPGELPSGQAIRLFAGFFGFFAACAAIFWAIAGWARGVYTWRGPAKLLVGLAIWIAFVLAAGPALQDLRYGKTPKINVQSEDENARKGVNVTVNAAPPADFVGSTFGPLVGLFVFGAASYVITRGRFRKKWESLELLLSGKVLSRQVARPVAQGALWGVAAATVPYVVTVFFRNSGINFLSTGVLSAPLAASQLLQPAALMAAFGYVGFAWPGAMQIRNKGLRILALVVVAGGIVVTGATNFESAPAGLIAGVLWGATWLLLFDQIDLLAVVSARLVARAVLAPAILLTQPVASLRESGVNLVLFTVAGLAIFVYYAIRGRDAYAGVAAPDLISTDPDAAMLRSRSSRERLEAEFQVARQAQQDALPAAAPPVEGYSLSAACEPAKQVGGDLYDYFPLPDGRLGIAVADVSGKGVPAALYMMVTKGLLTAAAQDSSDLAGILKGINTHLHRACKKKVFVTMAALAVEPGGRSVEYARAGHNPIVWRRASRGETVFVKPGGLGLGLCGSEQFGRSLRLERMELEPGDAVVLYSDGVTEAVNATLDQFGEDRLLRAVERADGRSAEETRASILRELAEFRGNTAAWDDITLVALRVGA